MLIISAITAIINNFILPLIAASAIREFKNNNVTIKMLLTNNNIIAK